MDVEGYSWNNLKHKSSPLLTKNVRTIIYPIYLVNKVDSYCLTAPANSNQWTEPIIVRYRQLDEFPVAASNNNAIAGFN